MADDPEVTRILNEMRSEWRAFWLEQAAEIVEEELVEGSDDYPLNAALIRIAAAIRALNDE